MADERVQRERHRRSSMAAVLYGKEYSPIWDDEEPENFVPTNLPEGTESMYLRLVNAGGNVKDKGLPESSHRTTDARRYWVSANVAKTATWIRWMQSASPAASNLPAAVGSQDRPPQDEVRCPGPLGSPANRTTNEPHRCMRAQRHRQAGSRRPPDPECRVDVQGCRREHERRSVATKRKLI